LIDGQFKVCHAQPVHWYVVAVTGSNVTGRFAPSSVRPWTFRRQDVSHPGRIQRFLLIQLKPKRHRFDVLN